jgi:hypothetical protein
LLFSTDQSDNRLGGNQSSGYDWDRREFEESAFNSHQFERFNSQTGWNENQNNPDIFERRSNTEPQNLFERGFHQDPQNMFERGFHQDPQNLFERDHNQDPQSLFERTRPDHQDMFERSRQLQDSKDLFERRRSPERKRTPER